MMSGESTTASVNAAISATKGFQGAETVGPQEKVVEGGR
jgi:hypothetical protein